MPSHETVHCPRCKTVFECRVGNVLQCQCQAVTLSEDERQYINEHYSGCLCADCLQHMKSISVMSYEKQIARSVTRIYKAVFPNTVNHYDTMFGGTAMQLMDEVAFITATRFSRMRVVTVSSDRIDFKKPIPHGTIIELIGEVTQVGKTSLKVRVTVYVEQMYSNHREKAIEGTFAFVAIDDQKRPTEIVLPPE